MLMRFSFSRLAVHYIASGKHSGVSSRSYSWAVMAAPSLRRFFTADFSSSASANAPKDPAFWNGLATEEKRKHYLCKSNYVEMSSVIPWALEQKVKRYKISPRNQKLVRPAKPELCHKVSLWQGDITKLEVDCIVNAANRSLLGGGGVDGAIHRGAGKSLLRECEKLNGCDTGDAKVTSGHRLPAQRVIHTVGPMGEHPRKLASCYARCLEELLKLNMKTIAFPCISTGIYGYPGEKAAHVALNVAREFLDVEENASKVDRIIFCIFLKQDLDTYCTLLPIYFPDTNPRPSSSPSGIKTTDTSSSSSKADEATGKTTDSSSNASHAASSTAAAAESQLNQAELEEIAVASLVEEQIEAEERREGDSQEAQTALAADQADNGMTETGNLSRASSGTDELAGKMSRASSGTDDLAGNMSALLGTETHVQSSSCSEPQEPLVANAVESEAATSPEEQGGTDQEDCADIDAPALKKAFTAPARSIM